MKSYKLHLIRHGLTQGNLEGRFVGGGIDLPVCEQGVQELQRLKSQFQYPTGGVLFTSPMLRATQTADLLYPEMQNKIVLEQLRENRFGHFEGKLVSELSDDPEFIKWMDPSSNYSPPGGESGADFAERTSQALLDMLEHMATHGIFEGVCIAHGGVIMSMLAQRALPKKPMPEWLTDNGCGFTVQTDAGMLMRDQLVEAVAIVPQGYMG